MIDRGMDLGLDGQYGKFRVTNKRGSINRSPRASNREIMDWLQAYEAGWDAAHRLIGDKCREYEKAGDSACAELVERLAGGAGA